MAKSLFIFLFFSFLFFSHWTYNYKVKCRKVSRDFVTISQGCDRWSQMVTSQVTVTVCRMTRVTWGPWESKRIATVVKYISSRKMSENSIEFSLSNSEQRDSWLNSSHRTLDADIWGTKLISRAGYSCYYSEKYHFYCLNSCLAWQQHRSSR